MDWLSDTNFVFVSSVSEKTDSSFLIQIIFIVAAAFLGAYASYWFTKKLNQKEAARKAKEAKIAKMENLNSLAISSMRKLSTATSICPALMRSYFSNISSQTKPTEYWQYVKGAVPISDDVTFLTDNEFEFMLSADKEGKLAHKIAELLGYVRINIATLNTYARYKEDLNRLMATHSGPIDPITGAATTEAPDLKIQNYMHIRIYEVNDMCLQLYSNCKEAIEISQQIVQELNDALPKLTQNPKFGKRLVVDF